MTFNVKPLLEEYLGIPLEKVEIWDNVFFVVPAEKTPAMPRFVNKRKFIETVFAQKVKNT